MAVVVRVNPIEVVDALAAIDIPILHLYDALLAGEIERDACTPHDPPSAPGYDAWKACVRTLRDKFCPAPHNWKARNENNLPMVVNEATGIAIVVTTGDWATGQVGPGIPVPTTKYPMGSITIDAVEENKRQLELFATQKPARESGAKRLKTYALVRHREGDTLYSELSLPYELRADNRVDVWAERNLLEPMKLDAPPTPADDTDTGDIDVPVRRRQ